MNELIFVERRRADWDRLAWLCARAENSPSMLTPAELDEFVKKYRAASGDLAWIRTRSTNTELIYSLNVLVGRAYSQLYRPRPNPIGKAISLAIATAAQTVRRCKVFVFLSAILFFGSGVFSYFTMSNVKEAQEFFIPEQFKESFDQWKTGKHGERNLDDSVMMTAFYATNNPLVAIMTASIGVATMGIGSAYFVYNNGAVLGALVHEVAPHGQVGHVLTSIFPHGVPELSGAIIAGAAGFVMGWALINPGRRRRGEALRNAGKDAITLLIVAFCLMVIAAPIEGFFSFNPRIPVALKVAVGIVEVIAWGLFWTFYAREINEEVAT